MKFSLWQFSLSLLFSDFRKPQKNVSSQKLRMLRASRKFIFQFKSIFHLKIFWFRFKSDILQKAVFIVKNQMFWYISFWFVFKTYVYLLNIMILYNSQKLNKTKMRNYWKMTWNTLLFKFDKILNFSFFQVFLAQKSRLSNTNRVL